VILGFSDAKLSVIKRGPEEVKEQGLLADHIGMKVCPRIIRFTEDGYEMELLEPPQYRSAAALYTVWDKLSKEVWPRNSWRGWNDGWLEPLRRWADMVPYLEEPIKRCYPEEPIDGYSLIHGDPTLANVMMRGKELVVTDPMPRMEYRKEMPNRREVDLGKLLQSAVGWERMLGCEHKCWDKPELVLSNVDTELRPKVMLWGAIHLARVGLRAPGKGRLRIASWAIEQSRILAKSCLLELRR